MISHRYYHRKSGHVIRLFINDESVPAIDINSIISEEAFHIRFNGHGQDKGKLNIRAPHTGSRPCGSRPEVPVWNPLGTTFNVFSNKSAIVYEWSME